MALSEQGYEVRLRLGQPPDEDFAFMASAEWFVQGAGGYSELIATVVAARVGPGRVRQIDGLQPEERHKRNPYHSEKQPGDVPTSQTPAKQRQDRIERLYTKGSPWALYTQTGRAPKAYGPHMEIPPPDV